MMSSPALAATMSLAAGTTALSLWHVVGGTCAGPARWGLRGQVHACVDQQAPTETTLAAAACLR